MGNKNRIALTIAALVCVALAASFLGYSLFPSTRETRFQAAAVNEDGSGVLVDFALRSRPGNGALLVNVADVEWRGDAERSFNTARSHAARILGIPLNNRDYELSVDSLREEGVAGESAGAALASAIIANYLNGQLRCDAIISAALNSSVESDDSLFPIGGADEKILAAAAAGKKLFLISESQPLKYEAELAKKIRIKRVRTLHEAANILLDRAANGTNASGAGASGGAGACRTS